jgi:hypothetical protein
LSLLPWICFCLHLGVDKRSSKRGDHLLIKIFGFIYVEVCGGVEALHVTELLLAEVRGGIKALHVIKVLVAEVYGGSQALHVIKAELYGSIKALHVLVVKVSSNIKTLHVIKVLLVNDCSSINALNMSGVLLIMAHPRTSDSMEGLLNTDLLVDIYG